MKAPSDQPIVVVIAGPNAAGKTTLFDRHLAKLGLPFVNPEVDRPHRPVGVVEDGKLIAAATPLPAWLNPIDLAARLNSGTQPL